MDKHDGAFKETPDPHNRGEGTMFVLRMLKIVDRNKKIRGDLNRNVEFMLEMEQDIEETRLQIEKAESPISYARPGCSRTPVLKQGTDNAQNARGFHDHVEYYKGATSHVSNKSGGKSSITSSDVFLARKL